MAETFEAYRSRVLSYLGDEEPIGVQQVTPSQLDRRLRDVEPEELIRRPAPEKWSIAEIVAHLADAELAMGWRLRNMLANPGVALTCGIRTYGRSAWVTRSKLRAFRRGSFGRCARATCDCWSRCRAHGGWNAMGSTRYADGKRSRSSSAWKRHTT
jgi:hypothetical protein